MQLRRQLVELEQLESQNRIDCNKIQVKISQLTSNSEGVSARGPGEEILIGINGENSPTPRPLRQVI